MVKKDFIVPAVSILFIILWLYAGLSKLTDFQTFRVQLQKSPMLTDMAASVAVAVPVTELALAYLLSFQRTRVIGLYGSLFLMSMFTTYLLIILNISYYIPCSCGGILGRMDWSTHIFFNVGFIILSIIALSLPAFKQRLKFYQKRLQPTLA